MFRGLSVRSLLAFLVLLTCIDSLAEAQGPPMVKNTGPKKLWRFHAGGTVGDGFEVIALRIPPGPDHDKFPARIWFYHAVPDTSRPGMHKLELAEQYTVPLAPRRPALANKRSNLSANPKHTPAGGTPHPTISRYIAVTGTQSPGGPTTAPGIKPMVRVITFLLDPHGSPPGPNTPAPSEGNVPPKHVSGCEDYPDDEMLQESDTTTYDPNTGDPEGSSYDPNYDPYSGATYP